MRWTRLNTMTTTCAVTLASAVWAQSPPAPPSPPPPPQLPTPLTACAAAMDCGLCPEAIVVAEMSASTTSMLSRIESAVDLRMLLAQQHEQLDAAALEYESLARQVAVAESDLANQQQAAKAAMDTAKAALETTRALVVELATLGLSETSLQKLANWRISATMNVPAAFRAHVGSEAQWRAIEGALRSEARALRHAGQPAPAVTELLASVRGDLDVVSASARLAQQLPGVEAEFSACIPIQSP